jgi:hypothetical protein
VTNIFSEKPKNLTDMTVEELRRLFPDSEKRTKFPHPLEILEYWEKEFHLDWGEPECFGCKHLTFSRSGAEFIAKHKGLGRFRVWNSNFQRCHIISATYGGPAQAWNLVFLCDWCHRDFDNINDGLPNNYDKSIDWLRNRRSAVLERMLFEVKPWVDELMRKFFGKNLDDPSLISFSRNGGINAVDVLFAMAYLMYSKESGDYIANWTSGHRRDYSPLFEVVKRQEFAIGVLIEGGVKTVKKVMRVIESNA